MNKEEIDKILSRLKRIDHKEYSCGFEFADSSTFEEMCICFEERKKLANYIKELQEIIEKTNNELDKLNIKLKELLSIGIDIREISYIKKILKGEE